MPRAPRVTGGQLVRALERMGWQRVELVRPGCSSKVTIPLHAARTIGPWLMARILRQAQLTVDELRSVL